MGKFKQFVCDVDSLTAEARELKAILDNYSLDLSFEEYEEKELLLREYKKILLTYDIYI